MAHTSPPTLPFPPPSPDHLCLVVHLVVPGQPPIPVEALVDSGASDCFLDPSILQQYDLHPTPHVQPIPIELIDGSTPAAGAITHYITTGVRVHGVHSEILTCHVMQLGHFKMVLGFPWLVRHNPYLDWSAGTLTFFSPFCRANYDMTPPAPA